MAPMTRSRCTGNLANEMVVAYYSARSTAGLIITEGTSPSPNGLGYARIPGLYTQDQCNSWKPVTEAVHKNGGKIFVQLMHTGRVSHPGNMPGGSKVLAPSSIACPGKMWTDSSAMQPHPAPQEMTEADIQHAIKEFGDSCRLAIQAGFDGIELHGANGYLIDQFLNTATNKRTDKWGGSVENRIRFAVEVAKAAVTAVGSGEKVGMRISPYGVFNGVGPDSEMDHLYIRLVEELNKLHLAYIHVVDHSSMGAPPVSDELKSKIRSHFKGTYILSGGYDAARANDDLGHNKGDLVAFGRPFIANPDLVKKLQDGTPLVPADQAKFYTPGPKGYTEL
jgi:N-ethylmaleimide reductase